jgi:hypothetical protein
LLLVIAFDFYFFQSKLFDPERPFKNGDGTVDVSLISQAFLSLVKLDRRRAEHELFAILMGSATTDSYKIAILNAIADFVSEVRLSFFPVGESVAEISLSVVKSGTTRSAIALEPRRGVSGAIICTVGTQTSDR